LIPLLSLTSLQACLKIFKPHWSIMMHDGEDKWYATRMALRIMNVIHWKKKTRGTTPWFLFDEKNMTPYLWHFVAKKKGTKAPLCYKKKEELDSFLLKKGSLVLFFCKTKKRTCKKKEWCSSLLQKI
jgi:hypothetical protein